MKPNYLGKKCIFDGEDMERKFHQLGESDYVAAEILADNCCFRQAVYCLIQSMEKRVSEYICKVIPLYNPNFSNINREIGHDVGEKLEVLIEIKAAGNKNLEEKLKKEVENLFEGNNTKNLNSNIRYPRFDKDGNWSILQFSEQDYIRLKHMYNELLKLMDRIIKL